MRYALIGLMALGLAACADAALKPEPNQAQTVCMPDGSVAWYIQADKSGRFADPRARPEYCPWVKK